MNCKPTQEQQWLLEAAFLEPQRAQKSWDTYTQHVDLQKADYVDTTLFPLVFRRFQGNSTAPLKTCKSVYRHTWGASHMQLFKMRQALCVLHKAKIEICLLKGAAMILCYYRDPGLRVIGDIDLLVPIDKAKEAVVLLMKEGWFYPNGQMEEKHIDSHIKRSHALMLAHQNGGKIDLHWSILAESWMDLCFFCYQPHFQEAKEALPAKILAPEDHLLHTFFHGLKYSPVPLIRWIPDAVTILRQTACFNWDLFFFQAKTLKIEYWAFQALFYLEASAFIQLPSEILKNIKNYKPTIWEKRHLKFLVQKPKKFFYIFQMYWHCHVRNSSSKNLIVLLATLPVFLKNIKKFSRWNQVFIFVFRGMWAHFKKAFVTQLTR